MFRASAWHCGKRAHAPVRAGNVRRLTGVAAAGRNARLAETASGARAGRRLRRLGVLPAARCRLRPARPGGDVKLDAASGDLAAGFPSSRKATYCGLPGSSV